MTENYDNNIYNEPYCVKDGCLYETVERNGKVTMVRLCDYVPVLKSEITFDDGKSIRGRSSTFQRNDNADGNCHRR